MSWNTPNWGVPSHSPPERQQVSRTMGGLVAAAGVTLALAMPGGTNQGQQYRAVKQIEKPQVELVSRVLFKAPAAAEQQVSITPATETDTAQALTKSQGPAIQVTLGSNEIKRITISDLGAISGTFTLTFNPGGGGQTTGTIAYNADAATVQAALEALSNIDPGDVVVTEAGLSGAETLDQFIEFQGQYARENLPNTGPNAITFATTPDDASTSVANTQNGGVAAETDASQALGFTQQAQSVSLTSATETDVAQALSVSTGGGGNNITPATETDAAQALGVTQQAQSVGITPATETDAAQALGFTQQAQSVGITSATETDQAQALTLQEQATPPPRVARAIEAHSPAPRQPVSMMVSGLHRQIQVDITPATETDTAVALTIALPPVVPAAVMLQSGTNQGRIYRQVPQPPPLEPKEPEPQVFSALQAPPPIFNVITQGGTNQGYKFRAGPQPVKQQVEMGSRRIFRTQAASNDIVKSLTAATETDTAQALSFSQQSQSKTITTATETDAAQSLSFSQQAQSKTITPATELDVAQPLSTATFISITPAVETNTAQGLSFSMGTAISKTLTPATELNQAVALSVQGPVGGGTTPRRTLLGMGT